MIDFHSHILPAIDDGAATLAEALAMAQVAWDDDVRGIVATPHSVDLGADGLEQLPHLLGQLAAAIKAHQPALELYAGLENYLTPDLAEHAAETGRSINGSRYFLVELPMQSYPMYTEQVLFQLQVRGYTPILAHPERNSAIQQDPNLLLRLVERGVLGQVTGGSLLGVFGSKTRHVAETLVQRNLVHLLGSDAHAAQGHRSPRLSQARDRVARLIGKERAQAMVDTVPRAILTDQAVRVDSPLETTPRRLFAFWRRMP